MTDDKTGCIRTLNDRLRMTGTGGQIVVTSGVAALAAPTVAAIFRAVQTFGDFTPDNDPYGEHDFALIEVAGERLMFKIDYYDRAMTGLSPDAARQKSVERIPLGRIATPEEVANVVLFLASDKASYVTAVNINMDGALVPVVV